MGKMTFHQALSAMENDIQELWALSAIIDEFHEKPGAERSEQDEHALAYAVVRATSIMRQLKVKFYSGWEAAAQ